ncbi:MAG: T9SS type A sorting domain-containing protein [Bacteroidetes bacterium]|nr:T9SS type A sorting domain-containing protein [Bacteroidota bacterium]
MKIKIGIFLLVIWQILSFTQNSFGQTTLLSGTGDGGFETGTTFALNNWTAVNTGQTNQWWCGTAVAGQAGVRCAYVGTTAANNNYTATAASIVHIYKNVTFPLGQDLIKLYFKYKVRGRSNEDFMEVSLVPTSVTPLAGVALNTGTLGTDYRNQTTWKIDSIELPCTVAGTTQRLVFSWINDNASGNNPAIAIDSVTVVSRIGTSCDVGLGNFNVGSLPYNSGPGTTCGFDDDINSFTANYCNDPSFLDGEDVVWSFTPTSSGQVTIDLNAPLAFATSLTLYDDCPVGGCSGIMGNCVSYIQDYDGSKSMCVTVNAGTTYYLVLDDGNFSCNDYDNLYISAVSATSIGATCANPVVISTLPYNSVNETTACMGDDYNDLTPGTCATVYNSGEDKVYSYVSAGNQCISITINNGSTSLMGFQVYFGCPGSGTCIATDGGFSPLVTDVTLPFAGTYYIVIDSWAPPAAVSYDLAIASFGSGAVNDLPCNAINLPMGTFVLGDNNCSTGATEAGAPLCWSDPGNLNTVWFKAIVPASGLMAIETQIVSIVDNQIEVFTGTCNALTPLIDGCNDNSFLGCGGLTTAATLQLNSLVPGSTLYIRVDGVGNFTGSFNIMASDSISQSGFNNQDCLGAIPVCGNALISQPVSFFGCGLIPEIPNPGNTSNPDINPAGNNSGCLLAGELNIVWYTIHINSPGLLSWTHTHPFGFYDWIMYDLTSSTCNDILNNTLAPVRCNWNGASSNLCGMQNPVPPGGSTFNFQDPLPVVAGQTIVLALSNYSYTTGGYSLDFSGSTAGIGNSPVINWSASATNNSWASSTNWVGCNVPACGVTTNIFPSSIPPVISANTTVQTINILGGASLTINPGVTVTVCGDLNNFGTINASPSSTIIMNNAAVSQTFDGLLTGTNKLGNVTITKTGPANANVDMDIAGNFTTTNPTSIFNTNNKYIRVGGHFTNAAGNATFTNVVPGGFLEFYGAGPQNYSPGGTLTLENVVLNHSGSGVSLVGSNMIIGSTGTLDLTRGKIITTPALEVIVQNNDPFSVFNFNTTSYVEGNLRRFLDGQASTYDFPVGHSVKGFQNATILFTTTTLIPDLRANFQTYASLPVGPVSNDCSNYDYSLSSVLDNGYWNINASTNGTSGTFDAILGNLNYTPTGNYATVLQSTVSPPSSLSWTLGGTCDPGSTPATTIRTGMNGFGVFGTGLGTPILLPVELISFTGENIGEKNMLHWTTASELNNQYFQLEHSIDGISFLPFERKSGAGNNTSLLSYEAVDMHPPGKISYYRLKQVDYDGKFSYSSIIAIEMKGSTSNVFLFPNPVTDVLNILLNDVGNENVSVIIQDVSGRKISTQEETVSDGSTRLTLSTDALSSGSYYLTILNSDSEIIVRNFFVKR